MVDRHPRISSVVSARRQATRILGEVLFGDAGVSQSELSLADLWHAHLVASGRFRTTAWYVPPPRGIALLIGNPPDYRRVDFSSLRSDGNWPRGDVWLTQESVLYAYASPIDARNPGLIGDVGVTLYRGSDVGIHEHLARCIHLIAESVRQIEVGMTFREVNDIAQAELDRATIAFSNRVDSRSDPTGVNIGHTIPWSYEDPTDNEREVLSGVDESAVQSCISRKRQFVNVVSSFRVPPTGAFTIEPRLAAPWCPTVSFHCIVIFRDGARSVVSGYRALFAAAGVLDRFDRGDIDSLDDAP